MRAPARNWVPPNMTRLGNGPAGLARWRLGPAGGGGVPLVLLPGIEGDARALCRLARLSARRPVFGLDLPEGTDLATLGSRVGAAIDHPRFVVFGCSLGGLVGRALAEQAPQRVAGLVTFGTLPARRFLPEGLAQQVRVLSAVPAALRRPLYRRRIRSRMVQECVAPELMGPLLDGLPPPERTAGWLRAIVRWGLAASLPVSTLWLRGQVDEEAPWAIADVATVLPAADVGTVPGGHRAPLTHPDGLTEALDAFLAQVD